MFVDRTHELGVNFLHYNGSSPDKFMPEIVGSGAALFDYDGDGDLDLFLVQSGPIKLDGEAMPTEAFGSRLFRNELIPDGRLHFVDATEDVGLHHVGLGMGVAVGDYDDDGNLDVYLSSYGSNHLLRNQGDGTFRDVTEQAGAGDDRWGTSASFLDYDRDGRLDLIVVNYVDFRPSQNLRCRSASGRRDYCGPQAYRGEPDRLLRNRGDGTFADVTERAGLIANYTAGLGVIGADFDGDGWQDIYVANDQQPNTLWMNQGDGTFSNEGLSSGTALNTQGAAEASMGVDVADFDDDGDMDIFLSHLDRQTNTLYVNQEDALFLDNTNATGLAAPSRAFTGFGTAFLDYDNDGTLDLVVANGAVFAIDALAAEGHPWPFGQRDQLFRGGTDGVFTDVTPRAGLAFEPALVSRGLAVGDVDNDGDVDLLISNNGAEARLLLNEVGSRNPWLGLRLVKETGIDDAGAIASLRLADGRALTRRAQRDGSYLSARDARVVFGLGATAAPARLTVRWTSGHSESWTPPPSGIYTAVVEGTGTPLGRSGKGK